MSKKAAILEFVNELSGFARVAEETLEKIADDKENNKQLFSVFSEKMLAIRGTSLQLEFPHIAEIAGLGEEIAIKGTSAESNRQIRKCVGSLWDALTTIKFLLQNHEQETSEEQDILRVRLQDTLRAFGGERPKVSDNEILELLQKRQ